MNLSAECFSIKKPAFLIFLCIAAVYGLAYYKRQASYAYWMENRDVYVVENVTAMSTMDAYGWIKTARDLDEGRLGKGLDDPTRGYPDLTGYPESASLLPRLISLSRNFTNGDYYTAGLMLIPLLAGLFVFPLFVYFNTLGFGPSAILGALIGSFSMSYYARSAMGRVDTDLMNLFFPMAVSALIVLIQRERETYLNLLAATGAGISMFLFIWWYQQPQFFLVYLFFIGLYLVCIRLPWKQTLFILLAFTIASGPGNVYLSIDSLINFFVAYFFPRQTGQVVWPEVMGVIQEVQSLDSITKLKILHGFLPITIVGLVGILYLYITCFKKMLPVSPLILIGLWSLFGPMRFTMYLAPFIGIGVGALLEVLARKIGGRFSLSTYTLSLVSTFLMLAVFFSTITYTGFNYIPAPSLSAATTKAFLEIKRIVPRHSAMFSSWSYGYPLMEIGEFATYQDNSSPGGMRSTLIAKAFTSPRQEDMVALISTLEDYGFNGLQKLVTKDNLSGDQMMNLVVNHPRMIEKDNIYILYTDNMIESIAGISTFGTWDFDAKTSSPMTYSNLHYFAHSENTISCKEGKIDLDKGTISDGETIVPLKAALFVRDGSTVDRFDYAVGKGVFLQVLLGNGQLPQLQVLEEPLFLSNFNQQYILGNYDRRFFEEVYREFPVARVLKVKKS